MAEDDVFSFVAGSIPSVWALELLLLLKRTAPAGRSLDALVRDLRSSGTAVARASQQLHSSGLIIEEAGCYFYRPASPKLHEFVTEIEKLYAVKPVSVIKAVGAVSNSNLQKFADSFKLKD